MGGGLAGNKRASSSNVARELGCASRVAPAMRALRLPLGLRLSGWRAQCQWLAAQILPLTMTQPCAHKVSHCRSVERVLVGLLTLVYCMVQRELAVAKADRVLVGDCARFVLRVRGSARPTMELLQVAALMRVVSSHMQENEVGMTTYTKS